MKKTTILILLTAALTAPGQPVTSLTTPNLGVLIDRTTSQVIYPLDFWSANADAINSVVTGIPGDPGARCPHTSSRHFQAALGYAPISPALLLGGATNDLWSASRGVNNRVTTATNDLWTAVLARPGGGGVSTAYVDHGTQHRSDWARPADGHGLAGAVPWLGASWGLYSDGQCHPREQSATPWHQTLGPSIATNIGLQGGSIGLPDRNPVTHSIVGLPAQIPNGMPSTISTDPRLGLESGLVLQPWAGQQDLLRILLEAEGYLRSGRQ